VCWMPSSCCYVCICVCIYIYIYIYYVCMYVCMYESCSVNQDGHERLLRMLEVCMHVCIGQCMLSPMCA
jgi:hypothetical protein